MLKRFALVLLLVLPLSAQAQQPMQPSPEQMAAMGQMMRELMIPLFKEMMVVMMEAQFEVLSEPDTAKALAAYSRNYYDELLKAGFSQEQAFVLTSTAGIPILPFSMGQN